MPYPEDDENQDRVMSQENASRISDKLRKMAQQCTEDNSDDLFKMAKHAETLTGLKRLENLMSQ